MVNENASHDPYDDYLVAFELDKYPYYYHWIFFSFLTCVTIHHVLSPLLFRRYNRAYREFPRAKRMEWDSRAPIRRHASTENSHCVQFYLSMKLLWNWPIGYPARLGLIALAISIGYFLCDIVSMPLYWRGSDLYIFLLHHFAAALAFQQVIQYRICTFFGVYRLTTELSTPFINQRRVSLSLTFGVDNRDSIVLRHGARISLWFYRTIGYTPDRRRVCSVTLMFAILFAITRNFMIIPFWGISYRALSSPGFLTARQAIPWLIMAFTVPPLILDFLNIYWASKAYRIGWRAAKCLWSADWRSDIRLAHARLRKRLRRLRHRKSSNSTSIHSSLLGTSAAVDMAETSMITSSSMNNVQLEPDALDLFILESSSSSSETEYEPADSEHEHDAAKLVVTNMSMNETSTIEAESSEGDQHLTQRTFAP
ncbi:Transmembrane protein 56 [Fasciola gigantica]|uniref:Transmembrane protein 56 n=1 Tax=Fasciola gigantica TaxID=46835 RepID=A0A504YDB9_FASGI|nr:Transmembrane protein 56 [Fasciola gigantica]